MVGRKKNSKESYPQNEAEMIEGSEAMNNQEQVSDEILSYDVETLRKTLAEEIEKSGKYLENWKRAEADFANYRKRSEQEKGEINHNTTCSVIYTILPILDDMERALASVPPESQNLPWLEGMRLIYKKLHSILQSQGLEEVCAIGQPFDPNLHEAIAHLEGKEGEVIEETQKGYKVKGKLIRPSMVVVGKGQESK